MDTVLHINPLNSEVSPIPSAAKPENVKEDAKSTLEFITTTIVGVLAVAWSFIWYPLAGALIAPGLLLYAAFLGAKKIWCWYDDCYSGQKDRFMGDRQADPDLSSSTPSFRVLNEAPSENLISESEPHFRYGA